MEDPGGMQEKLGVIRSTGETSQPLNNQTVNTELLSAQHDPLDRYTHSYSTATDTSNVTVQLQHSTAIMTATATATVQLQHSTAIMRATATVQLQHSTAIMTTTATVQLQNSYSKGTAIMTATATVLI